MQIQKKETSRKISQSALIWLPPAPGVSPSQPRSYSNLQFLFLHGYNSPLDYMKHQLNWFQLRQIFWKKVNIHKVFTKYALTILDLWKDQLCNNSVTLEYPKFAIESIHHVNLSKKSLIKITSNKCYLLL